MDKSYYFMDVFQGLTNIKYKHPGTVAGVLTASPQE
jgi:hypothetical protein